MNPKDISKKLLLIQLFLFILNLFIFSSRMRFLPWFIEDSFGLFGVFITGPLLLFIGVIMTYIRKRDAHCITRTKQAIPFLAAVFSIYIITISFTDFVNIVALVFTALLVVITVVLVIQDFLKSNK
ncbi:hypothetical protein V7024_07410 [Bacillus sp. JJ864]|uniref:hypothetical protein n=1 Tax=Bacillus sp. JJ864 TaxID=3122975 RepID=UPI0030006870